MNWSAIYKTISGVSYPHTLALAGLTQQKLLIKLEGQRLTIKGKPALVDKEVHYLHQGCSAKIPHSFTLAEHMTVTQVDFTHCLLNIDLEWRISESLQLQRVAIGTSTQCSPLQDRTLDTK